MKKLGIMNENSGEVIQKKYEFDYNDINEDMAVEALKTGDSKVAYHLNIFPIEIMQQNQLYKKRFKNNVYNELLIKNELAILYAKDGGNQWLIGERLSYIRDHKLHAKYGWSSFKDFIREDLPYAVSTVYNYIDIYKRFTYEESVKAGSKLSLFTQSLEAVGDEERKRIINEFASDEVSYRQAKRLSLKLNQKTILTDEEIDENVFNEVSKSIEKRVNIEEVNLTEYNTEGNKDKDPINQIRMSIFKPNYMKGEIVISEEEKKLIRKNKVKYPLILGFYNEYERRAINDILATDFQLLKALSKKVAKKIDEYKNHEKITISDID